MSSWRKLMSPVNEKYYPQDSSSSLAKSNFGKSSSLLQKGQESFQTTTTTYNDKLKTLHNQMSKLKGELSKYSTTRERNKPTKILAKINKTLGDELSPLSPPRENLRINQTQAIDTSHSPTMKIITAEELEEEEEEPQEEVKISPKRDRHHLKSDFTQHRQKMSISSPNSKYILQDALSPKSLMDDDPFADTIDNNKSNGKVIFVDDIQEKETTRYPKKSHAKTLSILKNGDTTKRDEDKFRTMKSTTRLRSKENNESLEREHERSIERSIDLKKALSEYCQQINELKQVALESQNQIAHLTEELAKEKKESSKLREEVHRSSKFIKAHMTEECDLPQPYQKFSKSRPKSTLQQIVNPTSKSNNNAIEQRRRRQKEDPQFFYTAVLDTTKERHADESTDLSNFRHNRKSDTGIQCELKDDNSQRIIYQNEQKIKEQEERISHLEAEVEKFKGHKNEMIATFQQIVSILSVSSEQLKDKNPAPKPQEIKSEFSNFYNTINAKLSTIASTQQAASTLKASKMNGFASYLAASKMSRHNKTEISDNLMYSPSNFDDDLMDSKYASAIRPYKGTLIFNGKASGISSTSP